LRSNGHFYFRFYINDINIKTFYSDFAISRTTLSTEKKKLEYQLILIAGGGNYLFRSVAIFGMQKKR
jgi:hypothetical protein